MAANKKNNMKKYISYTVLLLIFFIISSSIFEAGTIEEGLSIIIVLLVSILYELIDMNNKKEGI